MTRSLAVLSAGTMTTVQDLGRFGAQALGVSTSGALDPIALRLANALVGNTEGEAALELRFLGPRIQVRGGPARIALVGTSAEIKVEGKISVIVPAGQSITLRPDEVFQVSRIRDTSCCYLAVSGGFDLTPRFDSLSTFAPGGFGGYDGRALQDGDELSLADRTLNDRGDLQFARPFDYGAPEAIRVVLGPQEDHFTVDAIDTFLGTPYRISQSANRMGLCLEGATLTHSKGFNIPSDGIVTGAIQVPGTGLPVVLMVDRQTTGGYPKIATVISADLPYLGRMLPGQEIRFSAIPIASAEQIRRIQDTAIRGFIEDFKPAVASADRLDDRLMQKNLISGTVAASPDDIPTADDPERLVVGQVNPG